MTTVSEQDKNRVQEIVSRYRVLWPVGALGEDISPKVALAENIATALSDVRREERELLEPYEPRGNDVERLRVCLRSMGMATPESIEELGFRWREYLLRLFSAIEHHDRQEY